MFCEIKRIVFKIKILTCLLLCRSLRGKLNLIRDFKLKIVRGKKNKNQKLIIKHKTSVFIKHKQSTLKNNTLPILY